MGGERRHTSLRPLSTGCDTVGRVVCLALVA